MPWWAWALVGWGAILVAVILLIVTAPREEDVWPNDPPGTH